jgi:fatty-acyl-CoA synthase
MKLPSDSVAALWDLHHLTCFAHESRTGPSRIWALYIKYVHIKDSVETEKGIEYRMLGEGDLPIDEMMQALRSIVLQRLFVSLEWVKRWAKDLQDAGIVFPHFVNYMERFAERRGRSAGSCFPRGEYRKLYLGKRQPD